MEYRRRQRQGFFGALLKGVGKGVAAVGSVIKPLVAGVKSLGGKAASTLANNGIHLGAMTGEMVAGYGGNMLAYEHQQQLVKVDGLLIDPSTGVEVTHNSINNWGLSKRPIKAGYQQELRSACIEYDYPGICEKVGVYCDSNRCGTEGVQRTQNCTNETGALEKCRKMRCKVAPYADGTPGKNPNPNKWKLDDEGIEYVTKYRMALVKDRHARMLECYQATTPSRNSARELIAAQQDEQILGDALDAQQASHTSELTTIEKVVNSLTKKLKIIKKKKNSRRRGSRRRGSRRRGSRRRGSRRSFL